MELFVGLSRTETNPKEIVRLFSLVSIFLILAFNSGPVELYRDLPVHKNIYSSDKRYYSQNISVLRIFSILRTFSECSSKHAHVDQIEHSTDHVLLPKLRGNSGCNSCINVPKMSSLSRPYFLAGSSHSLCCPC